MAREPNFCRGTKCVTIATFRLNGIDTVVLDPDPAAGAKVQAVWENAKRAFEELMPQEFVCRVGGGGLRQYGQIDTFQHHPRIQNLILCSNMGLKCVYLQN